MNVHSPVRCSNQSRKDLITKSPVRTTTFEKTLSCQSHQTNMSDCDDSVGIIHKKVYSQRRDKSNSKSLGTRLALHCRIQAQPFVECLTPRSILLGEAVSQLASTSWRARRVPRRAIRLGTLEALQMPQYFGCCVSTFVGLNATKQFFICQFRPFNDPVLGIDSRAKAPDNSTFWITDVNNGICSDQFFCGRCIQLNW